MMKDLPHLLTIAAKLEAQGCAEAGFRTRLQAITNPDSPLHAFPPLIILASRPCGTESVSSCFSRLECGVATAVSRAHSADVRSAYCLHLTHALMDPMVELEEGGLAMYERAKLYLGVSPHLAGRAGREEEMYTPLALRVVGGRWARWVPERE